MTMSSGTRSHACTALPDREMSRRRPSREGRPHGGVWGALLLLVLVVFTGCGGVANPAGKVAEGFFTAVREEDPAALRELLEPAARAEFEAAMSDAELADHLADANAALSAQYGDSWRSKLRVLSIQKGEAGDAGTAWSVTVSLGTADGDRQDVPVWEKDGAYWLDLSWIDPGR